MINNGFTGNFPSELKTCSTGLECLCINGNFNITQHSVSVLNNQYIGCGRPKICGSVQCKY
jgi:hypothetical protein